MMPSQAHIKGYVDDYRYQGARAWRGFEGWRRDASMLLAAVDSRSERTRAAFALDSLEAGSFDDETPGLARTVLDALRKAADAVRDAPRPGPLLHGDGHETDWLYAVRLDGDVREIVWYAETLLARARAAGTVMTIMRAGDGVPESVAEMALDCLCPRTGTDSRALFDPDTGLLVTTWRHMGDNERDGEIMTVDIRIDDPVFVLANVQGGLHVSVRESMTGLATRVCELNGDSPVDLWGIGQLAAGLDATGTLACMLDPSDPDFTEALARSIEEEGRQHDAKHSLP